MPNITNKEVFRKEFPQGTTIESLANFENTLVVFYTDSRGCTPEKIVIPGIKHFFQYEQEILGKELLGILVMEHGHGGQIKYETMVIVDEGTPEQLCSSFPEE